MAPLSLKIVQDGGAITRTILFDTTMKVSDTHDIVRERMLLDDHGKDYGLFLTSADDESSGIWLEGHRTLDYYMLRDGDSLQYLCRTRNLRVQLVDGSVKTIQIDESKCVGDIMMSICDRIGITNHEEYGLCFVEKENKPEEEKPATGTLTLKRKQQTREKDAQLEQLSKKLKTDDNVEWLAKHKTLREIGVDSKETLLMKRRLFYTDRNVDSRDPVQLNLLYVQTRDAILDGRQVVTEQKAIEFAGIQCQVQYGDCNEEKHKPGFIENLNEFLSEQYANSRGVERKVLKEYSRHYGLTPLEAKNLYTKTARELPTYGVTFFLVKEQQKGKKKLVPRLLGINAESILRLDEVTKEILQVWPLTQVRTFRAGRETFTLDFGDYSDKEYTVKTNEAYRIRDILQGYIDIIHKSLAAPFNLIGDEGQAICEDTVESFQGHMIQNIAPMKIVEQSFVGPSKLVPFAESSQAQQGTQIMTVSQMVVTNLRPLQRRGTAGDSGMRGNSTSYLKKLNRVNANSMETVEFLTDPNNQRGDKVAKVTLLATIIEEDMNSIIEGVHQSVKNDNEDIRKKLLSELDELCASFNDLIDTSKQGDFGSPESLTASQEAAEKIVGLCTDMFCSLDPGIKRRSRILKRSHESFIADEKTEATLRRASFIAAASHACKAVDRAKGQLDTMYEGGIPEGYEVMQLELDARKKVGKLNAAIALLMSAQSDPDNLDYSAAITSMTTIDELLPELIQDAKALSSGKDEKSRLALLNRIRAMCDAARNICALSGEVDKEQLQELAYKYAKASDKLLFTFGRGSVADKENEILDVARDIGDKTSMLLMKIHELNNLAQSDPRADELDKAGARCADDSRVLLACAQLTASSIEEPHCQSAMSAAAESLTSSVHHLTTTWKPLVEEPGRKMFEHSLNDLTSDLMKALDRLRDAYADLSAEEVFDDNETKGGDRRKDRLKFIATLGTATNKIEDAHKKLDKPVYEEIDGNRAKKLERQLAQRLALLNSAIASLICATADRENPDYKTAEQAIATVSELMPELVRDAKAVSAAKDDKAAHALLNDIRALCEATRDLCSVHEDDTMLDKNDAASKFANSSSKLCFVFTPKSDVKKQNMIIELSKDACEKASELLTHVNQLVDEEGGERGALLDERGASLVDVVQGLLTAAQLTAPSFDDPRCQSTMLTAADDVSTASKELASIWTPLIQNPTRHNLRLRLNSSNGKLEEALNNLRAACNDFAEDAAKNRDDKKQRERLKFIATIGSAANSIADAQKELDEPMIEKIDKKRAKELQKLLADRLALLNSAIASLVFATADRENPDYNTAEQAIATVSEIMPELVRDVKTVSTDIDDKVASSLLNDIRALCEATQALCSVNENGSIQDRNNAASKFAKSSSKLYYVFTPKADLKKGNMIIELSKDACEKASELLTHVNQLVDEEGGEKGVLLDERGVSLVDVAQGLLIAAQITAPSFSDSQCQSGMLMIADEVVSLNQELASIWSPLVQNPSREMLSRQLNSCRNELEAALNNLRSACKIPAEEAVTSKDSEKRKDRLKFVATVGSAADRIADAQKELDGPTGKRIDEQRAKELQKLLADRLALLNAAIASLMFATADRENPDYETADKAIATVSELMPELIRDVKAVSSTTENKAANALLNDIRALCDATRDLCNMNENATIQDRNDAASNFAKSSSKLYYVFTPRADPKKGNKIVELSKDACEKASELLTHVNQLVDEEGGEKGALLDERGASLVDVVQGLLTAAQLTAPSFGDPRCQSAMLMTVDEVSSLNQKLASIWSPLVQSPVRDTLRQQLNSSRNELEAALNKLRAACKTSADDAAGSASKDGERQKDRLRFIATVGSTANKIADVQKELDKPVRERIDLQKTKELQKLLADRLALLNSAIASLMVATADRENPDYKKANQAIATVSEFMPELIQDVKVVSATKDDKASHALINDIKALCEATRDLCSVSESGDIQDRSEAAAKYARASSKLCYVFAPKIDSNKGNLIIELSKDACEKASELLTHVNQLVDEEGGEKGALLDERGASLVDVAQGLLTAAQLTAPSFDDPRCQSTMLMTADEVFSSCQELASLWVPLVQDPSRQKLHQKLELGQSKLEAALNNLRTACKTLGGIIKTDADKHKMDKRDTTSELGEENLSQIGNLSREVAIIAGEMREHAGYVASSLGEEGKHIHEKGGNLVSTAEELCSTVAEVMKRKQHFMTISCAVANVTAFSTLLKDAVSTIIHDARHKDTVQKIEHGRKKMESKLDKITACLLWNDALQSGPDSRLDNRFLYDNPTPTQGQVEMQTGPDDEITSQMLNKIMKSTHGQDASKHKARRSITSTAKTGLDPVKNVQRMGELTKDVFDNASKISEVVRGLASNLGEDGEHIGDCGERLLHTAQNLQSTVSEIAQSCEKPDISRIATAVNTVSSCSTELGTACSPIRKDPAHKKAVDKIEHERQKLEYNLNDIKRAVAVQIDDPSSEEKRLNFITTLSEAKNNVQNAEKLINKPSSVQPRVKGADLQRLLAQRLAQLNLAIASLVQSADDVNPNYVDANAAAETIAKLLPDIIRDSNALTKDDASRRDMMMKLKDLCDATKELCLEAELGQSKGASDSISKFANASNKLHYVFSPRADVKRENEIVELCKKVQDQAYTLQSPSLVEAARRLLTTAQITASSIEDPSCQSKLLSTADEVLSLTHRQDGTWSNLPPHEMNKLNQERAVLANVLNEIKAICKDATDATLRPVKPPVPKRVSSLNADQGQAVAEKLQFMKIVDDAVKSIDETKEQIIKISSDGFEVTSSEAAQVASEQLERKLALASAAVSHLVFCNDPKKINLKIPSKSTKSLSDLFPTLVKDLRKICSPDNPKSKLIIDDAVNLCVAARTLCITARDNNEKLNEVAVDYANKSAKLLYEIDIRADPNQEKEVLDRAKVIGDCASRLATGGVTVAQNLGSEDADNLCEAGSRCADAASKLLYVTKLVAPSIQYPQNQNIVLTANDQLLARVSDFSSILAPLQLQPEQSTHLKDLETAVQSLEKLLKEIKEDIQDKKLVKRKKVEVLEIEDTPMRQLAMEILDNFKVYIESPDLSMDERSRYAQIADKLSAAIKELDVANALCRKSPQDIGTLRRLENATQDLQHALLQSRDEQSNVVDIMDFVKEVISNIEALSETANEITQEHPGVYLQMLYVVISLLSSMYDADDSESIDENPPDRISTTAANLLIDQPTVQSVKENCDKMAAGAIKLTRPPELGDESTLNDTLLDVVAFAQDCQKTLPLVSSEAKSLPDVKTRRQLEFKAQRLTDSVNLLSFAVKSALATANSVALDETLVDLSELENKLSDLLKPIPGMKHLQTSKDDSSALERVWYSAAVRQPATHNLGPALTSYVTEQRVRTNLEDPQRKRRLEEHLRRLLLLLKTMVVNTSRCTATWRGDDNSDGVTIGENIIQELEDYESSNRKEGDQANQLVNNADVRRLLFPSSDLPVNEDKKELTKKLHHAINKLDSLLGAITYSVDKPQALSRSLHATAVAAIEYDKISRALGNTENQIQGNRIEESAKDMRFATFRLLKEAEQISREPNSIHRRRKLLDAIRSLNDSINKLSRAADSNNSEDETICSLRLQQTLLQCLRPTCTLGYANCVEALQSQADVISNVGKDVENHVGMKELSASTSLAADYAMHCAYLISISEKYQETAKCGLIDVTAINKAIESIQDKCVRVICSGNVMEAKDAEPELSDNVRRIQEAFAESKGKILDLNFEREMQASLDNVNKALATFKESLHAPNLNDEVRVNTTTLRLLDAVAALKMICLKPEVVPSAVLLVPETKNTCDLLLNNARELLGKTITLLNETNKVGDRVSAQARLHTLKTGIVQEFDALVENITENGRRVGLLEAQVEEEEQESQNKSYIANQFDLAAKWLKAPKAGEDAKSSGVEGVKNVIKIAKETVEGLKDLENDEMLQVINEVEKLSEEVSSKYNKEKSRILMQRLQELRKMLDRVVVARVVEEFLEEDAPLNDLELMADDDKAHFAELKQHQLLEKTARAVRTARLVATAANASTASSLNKVSAQVEMLAPSLVKAMDERIRSPNHQKILDDYKALMAQYEQTMSIVRMLCDQSIDPVEFVQTAGETMQRMCEESSAHKDPLKSAHTSNVITRLGQRVVEAGLSSRQARGDPELRRALAQAQRRLQDSTSNTIKNDWRQVMAEILQTTNEVESALSGENIFQKQLDPNQPIFAAALDLHAAVREWSAKDNEIVAVAKRMAVLMARLSDYMNHDKKREVLATSKSIVKASSEVAALARNLALECTDLRIRTNLLQLCDRIPTISGQLKMLTTVKGSSLGRQGNEEDKEAMNMLVGNAQNLMLSIQEVVSAAAAASVKIMSQRGPRMRWVRKNYYNY